jgi:hypothetical protein
MRRLRMLAAIVALGSGAGLLAAPPARAGQINLSQVCATMKLGTGPYDVSRAICQVIIHAD